MWPSVRLLPGLVRALVARSGLFLALIYAVLGRERCSDGSSGQREMNNGGFGWRWPRRREKSKGGGEKSRRERGRGEERENVLIFLVFEFSKPEFIVLSGFWKKNCLFNVLSRIFDLRLIWVIRQIFGYEK